MRKMLLAAAAAVAALLTVAPAMAQGKYPSQPIRVLVPYSPGGATDFAARLVAKKVEAALGVAVVVENKPGAQGMRSLEDLARSKPDGYTLMIGNVTTNCITPVLFVDRMKAMNIDFDRDIMIVARLLVTPNVLLTTAKGFGPKTFAETIDHVKKNPGKVRYGSSGIGSFPHFDTALLAHRAGLDMIHVPYKDGAGAMVHGIVNGDIQITLLSTPITIPQVKAGTVHVIANINRRLPQFPDSPTLAELGFPGVGTDNWSGLFAPTGTPKEVVDLLFKAFTDAAKDPEVVEAAAKTGTDSFPAESVDATQKWLRSEMDKWRGIVKEVKVELN